MTAAGPKPDALGADLVALGLIRATADAMLPNPTATDEQQFRRCAELVEGWVGGPDAGVRGELREPLLALLDVLARRAALYLVVALDDDPENAATWLAEQSVKARQAAREDGDSYPSAPAALALVGLHVESLAQGGMQLTKEELDNFARDRAERHRAYCDRYVREDHVAQDAYGLVLSTGRVAATVLVHLAGSDRAAVEKELDEQAAALLDEHDAEVPAWVPATAAGLTVQYRATFSDAYSYEGLEPVYATVAEAQRRCEEELRGQREDGDRLVITWRSNDETAPILWDMYVQTPRLPEPARLGYAITVVGCEFDGGPGSRE
ncbi:hypothetical protein ACFWA9_10145 [Kitasatospora sp. NPDC059973]|uniref:hypothetical protein n=1 Tax=Kitasatospora sp. NPDC059973 TaxID=3347020 RepID=UPI0036D0EB38